MKITSENIKKIINQGAVALNAVNEHIPLLEKEIIENIKLFHTKAKLMTSKITYYPHLNQEIMPDTPEVLGTTMMSFEDALRYLKQGERVGRREWKNALYVFLVEGSEFTASRAPLDQWFDEGEKIIYRPHIDMCGADNTIGTWAPLMVDLMAVDWYVYHRD